MATSDPFPKVNGLGLLALEAKGLHVETGCEARAARLLDAPYLKRSLTGRPFVIAKWAMTLDGKTAASSGDSRWIYRINLVCWSTSCGAEWMPFWSGSPPFSDDPLLTARPPGPRCPARVVLDSTARLPVSSRLVNTVRDAPVIVATTEGASPDKREQLSNLGCEVIVFPGCGRVPIEPLLDQLGRPRHDQRVDRGRRPRFGSFLDAGQVDAVDVFIAPILEGGDHAQTAARGRGMSLMRDATRLRGVELSQVDADIRLRGWLPQSWRTDAGLIEDE